MGSKVLLMILDGWGLSPEGKEEASAIAQAKTSFIDKAWQRHPHARLQTHGVAVGLPKGQMGNSEVGHMNLGAGRVVYQDLLKINLAIEDGTLRKNILLQQALEKVKSENRCLHLMGMLSDGGVHGHVDHLKALITIAAKKGIDKVFIHAITDGRDTDPKSGIGFLKKLEHHCRGNVGKVATVTGRYYAMDRDTRWERTKKAYDAIVYGKGKKVVDLVTGIKESYEEGITDEFMEPMIAVNGHHEPLAKLKDGDVLIFANFRNDRARQITEVLTQKDRPEQGMHKRNLIFLPFKLYDASFDLDPLFETTRYKNTLGEVLAKNNKTQLRIAETEKYAHVTYFFNAGREGPFEGEERIIVDSPRDVANYDEKPEMSAKEITEKVIDFMQQKSPDFICLNFANADMVGHTGDFEAVKKACSFVDVCAKQVTEAARKENCTVLILADHGNADHMKNEDGSPNTNHSKNLVPLIVITDGNEKVSDGKLNDIAPTILRLMGLEIPGEMTGNVLVSEADGQ